MTQKNYLYLALGALSLVLYDVLFWHENLGLNVLFFILWIVANIRLKRPLVFNQKLVLITFLGTLITSFMAIFIHSAMALTVQIISAVVMVGFMLEHKLKSPLYSVVSYFENFFNFSAFVHISLALLPQKALFQYRKILRVATLVIIPLVVCSVFYVIYVAANPKFAKLSLGFVDKIADVVFKFFNNFSILHILFWVLGVFLVVGVQHYAQSTYTSRNEASFKLSLIRTKNRYLNENFGLGFKLKTTYLVSALTLSLVNVLLLVVNVVDIQWLWFGFTVPQGFNLSQFVHEGTYLLIFSILLSMGILLTIFKGSLNFYPKSALLRKLAYIWIVQNGIMTISVVIRNFYYMDYHGLAYKRIGVLIFLTLVLFGLVTFFIKIYKQKSSYYLWHHNSWAVYVIAIAMACFNWDMVIAKHNLAHTQDKEIDTHFLLTLSPRVYPLLRQHTTIFSPEQKQELDYLETRFKDKYQKKISWQDWNYADYHTYKQLTR